MATSNLLILWVLEVNNALYKQTLDKQMTMMCSFYAVCTVANGAYNSTILWAPGI